MMNAVGSILAASDLAMYILPAAGCMLLFYGIYQVVTETKVSSQKKVQDRLRGERTQADVVYDDIDRIPDGHAPVITAADDLLDLRLQRRIMTEVVFRRLEAVEAGGARNHHVLSLLLRGNEIPRRQRDRELEIGVVGGAGAAAGPVLDLLEIDPERAADRADRLVVLLGRAVQ